MFPDHWRPGNTVIVGRMPPEEKEREYLTLKVGILVNSTTSFRDGDEFPRTYWSVYFPQASSYFPPSKLGNRAKDGWSEIMQINETLLSVCSFCVCLYFHFVFLR